LDYTNKKFLTTYYSKEIGSDKLKKHLSILLISLFFFSGCIGQGNDERQENVVLLVTEAANLVQQNGEEAFPQFRTPGKFFTDDFYIFVWKVEGDKITRVVYPLDSNGEGVDVSDLKDNYGVSLTKMFMAIANSDKGEGWSEQYVWINPKGNKIEKKVAYIKKVVYGDTTYILGAGYYL
jgi:signal transduction histidine kinase